MQVQLRLNAWVKVVRLSCPQPGNALKLLSVTNRLGAFSVVAQEATNRVANRIAKVFIILVSLIAPTPNQIQLPCRLHVIQPSHRLGIGRAFHQVRGFFRFFLDLRQRVNKPVQLVGGFGFRGFDQPAFRHQQWEVGGGGVITVIQHALGKIHCGNVQLFSLFAQGDDEFVGGASIGVLVSSFCSRNVASRLGSLAALSGAAVLRQNATSLQNFAAAMRLMALNCAAAQMMAQRDAGMDEQP